MTGPAWDGDGVDPWLPQRLAAQARIVEAERSLFDDFLARLSGWLVRVARSVLSGVRPDPAAVWSRGPEWRRLVDGFAQGPVRDVVGSAFAPLLGDGYRWDLRPNVVTYLAQVSNRLVGVPDDVYALVAGQVAEGANVGESIGDLSARVDEVLSATATPRWSNRSVVVSRTEALGALNAGRHDAFQAYAEETDDGTLERVWLATSDARTRDSHRDADGARAALTTPFTVGGVPLMFPGDPTGPPAQTVQCRCTTLLVRRGESVDLSGRGWN